MELLRGQDIDRVALARALEELDPIWEALVVPERERILQLLIERITFDGRGGNLAIEWRLRGFGQLAEEIGA